MPVMIQPQRSGRVPPVGLSKSQVSSLSILQDSSTHDPDQVMPLLERSRSHHTIQRSRQIQMSVTAPEMGVRNPAVKAPEGSVSSRDSNQTLLDDLSKKQVLKKVAQWFEIWQPWQQKELLNGLTNRCSTNQLEALATTMEPVFHRDFVAGHKRRYPSSPLKQPVVERSRFTPRRPSSIHTRTSSRQTTPMSRSNKRRKEMSNVSLESIEEKESEHLKKATPQITNSATPLSIVVENDLSCGVTKQLDSGGVYNFAESLLSCAMEEALAVFKPAIETVEDYSSMLTDAILQDALEEMLSTENNTYKNDDIGALNFSDALGNLVLLPKNVPKALPEKHDDMRTTPTTKSRESTKPHLKPFTPAKGQPLHRSKTSSAIDAVNSRSAKSHEGPHHSSKSPRLSSKRSRTNLSLASSSKSSIPFTLGHTELTSSYFSLYPEKTMPLSESAQLSNFIRQELSKKWPLGSRQSVASVDLLLADKSYDRRAASQHHNSLSGYHNNRNHSAASTKSSVSSGSYWSRTRNAGKWRSLDVSASAPVYGSHRPGNVKTGQVQSVSVSRLPVQSYSHGNLQTSRLDNFSTQLHNIWTWLETWEDYERLTLLSEVIKLCGSGQISYLSQCLVTRLHQRINIGWLPDHLLLLIFSYLHSADISSCTRVCQRWRHMTAMDELWMIKCLEFGQSAGVPDLVRRVAASRAEECSIDWKMAYFELQKITRETKSALAKPNPILLPPNPVMSSVDMDMNTFRAELPLRKGLAAQLAKESQMLKEGQVRGQQKVSDQGQLRVSDEEDTWWRQREAMSLSASAISTLGPLPNITRRADGQLQKSQEYIGSEESGSRLAGKSLSSVSLLAPSLQYGGSKGVVTRTSVAAPPQQGISTEMLASHSSDDNKGIEKMESKAVMQWIRGHKRPDKDDGDIALDIRPDLQQERDLLGKSHALRRLLWKDPETKATAKFAGKVPGVMRVRKLHGHMDSVLCLQFSPKRLISGSQDRSIRVWDIKSGRSIHKMYGHKGAVTCLYFEKAVLYTGSWDTQIMVWNLVSFEREGVMFGHRNTVTCLAASDDLLFSGSHDATVRVWSRIGHYCTKTLNIHDSHIMALAVDGSTVITGSSDKTIRLTDYKTEQCVGVIEQCLEPITKLTFHGNLIVSSTMTGRVYFWNRETCEPEAAIQAHNSQHPITALIFHKGRLFTASGDQTVKEWDLMTLTCVRMLQGHKAPITDLKVSDRRMVSCSSDGQIRIWDLEFPDKDTATISDDCIPHEIVNQRELSALKLLPNN